LYYFQEAVPVMGVNVTESSRRRKWHIDHFNDAPDAAEALARALRFMRAELKACKADRPGEVDGLTRHLAYLIADFLRKMPASHPAPEFRESMPALPGGGWSPVPHKGAAAAVEHP
jgi:hypothetical protein